MKHLKMFEDFTIDGFDMEYFKQLSSFRKRIDYCGKYLKRLSSGSSRIVYIVDEQKVLKIAKNTRGLEQNRAEGDYFIQKKYIDVVTEMYDKDDQNYTWILCERARKLTPNKFTEMVGIPLSKVDFYLNLKYAQEKNAKVDKKAFFTFLTGDEITKIENSSFCQEILSMMYEVNLLPGDLGRLSSYGIVKRKDKEVVVLLDYGVSEHYDIHYK